MTELNYQKGDNALQHGNYKDAVIYFTNSLQIEKSSGSFQNRAFAYMNLGKMELAKNDYEAAATIIINYLKQADKNDKSYIDLCLRDLINAKATIAFIEMENENFLIVENLYSELIDLYTSMFDNSILSPQSHISRFYSDRGIAKFSLNKVDEATRDMGAAFVESNSEKTRQEILRFAVEAGVVEKVNQSITLYSLIKNKIKQMNKQCKFCDKIIDISQCDDFAKPIIEVNDLICSSCQDTIVLYTCKVCAKTVIQPVASSLTKFGFLIKKQKVCLDCNSQMIEEIQ